MKGLVFGNSHVSAIRMGWSEASDLDVDFFGISGGGGPAIQVRDGRIFSRQSDNAAHSNIGDVAAQGLDVSQYDYIAVCSLGLGAIRPEFPAHIAQNIALVCLQQGNFETVTAVSESFMEQAIQYKAHNMAGFVALNRLNKLFRKPIYCVPTPLPVLSLIGGDHPLRQIYGSAVGAFISWFATTQRNILDRAIRAAFPSVRLLGFPDAAWLEQGGTPEEFVFRKSDAWHMNAAYGQIVLKQVAVAMEET